MSKLYEADMLHAQHYLTLLAEADDLFVRGGEDARLGLALFDEALENIRNGQARVREYAAVDETGLCRFFAMRGANLLNFRFHPREVIDWGEASLEAARRLNEQADQAVILTNVGMAYEDLGDFKRSLEFQLRALEIARAVGYRDGEAAALGNLGSVYYSLNRHKRAARCYRQQFVMAEEIGDRRGAASGIL